jgi:hypothetical protein
LFWLIATWQAEAVPQGAQPVPEVFLRRVSILYDIKEFSPSSPLSTSEIKGLGKNNDTRRRVTEVRDQLGSSARVDRSSRATTSHTLSETLSGTSDTDSSGVGSESRDDSKELHFERYLVVNTEKKSDELNVDKHGLQSLIWSRSVGHGLFRIAWKRKIS